MAAAREALEDEGHRAGKDGIDQGQYFLARDHVIGQPLVSVWAKGAARGGVGAGFARGGGADGVAVVGFGAGISRCLGHEPEPCMVSESKHITNHQYR